MRPSWAQVTRGPSSSEGQVNDERPVLVVRKIYHHVPAKLVFKQLPQHLTLQAAQPSVSQCAS